MATYRSSTHDRLRDRLVDAAIGTLAGSLASVPLFIATVWLVMR